MTLLAGQFPRNTLDVCLFFSNSTSIKLRINGIVVPVGTDM